jgi:hypothetical protein
VSLLGLLPEQQQYQGLRLVLQVVMNCCFTDFGPFKASKAFSQISHSDGGGEGG